MLRVCWNARTGEDQQRTEVFRGGGGTVWYVGTESYTEVLLNPTLNMMKTNSSKATTKWRHKPKFHKRIVHEFHQDVAWDKFPSINHLIWFNLIWRKSRMINIPTTAPRQIPEIQFLVTLTFSPLCLTSRRFLNFLRYVTSWDEKQVEAPVVCFKELSEKLATGLRNTTQKVTNNRQAASKIKVKFTLEKAMTAQRGCRGTALLFL